MKLEFTLPEDLKVKLKIFNLSDQHIATVFEGDVKPDELRTFDFNPSYLKISICFFRKKVDFCISNYKSHSMARVCEITGKRPISGFYVSKSNRKTKRRFLPNLREKRFFVPELNKWMTLKVTSAAMRTISKKGLYNCLKELEKKGEIQLN